MARVALDRVTKRYPESLAKRDRGEANAASVAVDQLDLQIHDQEFLVLVGPSGCGKSTTLRMIAGLETCTSGEIRIGDRVVNNVRPKDRDVAMVFQNFALYPNMSVYRNMSFGLTLRFGGGVLARGLRKIFQPRRAAELSAKRAGIDRQVRQAADRLGITHLLDRRPHQLSGGERQRVALGRAIVREPAVFLFDEPLSNLDAKLRQQMRVQLKRLHRDLRTTIVYVTHDQIEAMTLGDRVAVMNEGRLQQIGRPLEVYQQPANLFVARFIGNVPMNLQRGTMEFRDDGIRFSGGGCRLNLDSSRDDWTNLVQSLQQWIERSGEAQKDVIVGFRSEHVFVTNNEDELDKSLTGKGKCTATDHLGDSIVAWWQLDEGSPTTCDPSFNRVPSGPRDHAGDSRGVAHAVKRERWERDSASEMADDAKIHAAENNSTITDNLNDSLVRVKISPDQADLPEPEIGKRGTISVPANRLLWFDPETGKNILKEQT